MRIAIIISIVFTVLHLAFNIFKNVSKANKERKIFGGKTKREFLATFTKDWKNKYFDAMRLYLSKDRSEATESWKNQIYSNAEKNGLTYDEQKEFEIDYLWNTYAKNTALFENEATDLKSLTPWRKDWVLNNLNRHGIEPTNEVITELVKIGRKV